MRLRQPRAGYRAAIDPVLLAASVPDGAKTLFDLGCGAGAAALCALARRPELRATGIENDPEAVTLARHNISLNGFTERMSLVAEDLRAVRPSGAKDVPVLPRADCVIANPPFLDSARADPSPIAGRARANVEGEAALRDWLDAALRLCRPRGWIVVVHRADRLDDILAGLGPRAGDIVVYPLWPKAGVAAKRVLIGARPGARAPLRLAPGLVLHQGNGGYTDAADAALRGGAIALWPSAA